MRRFVERITRMIGLSPSADAQPKGISAHRTELLSLMPKGAACAEIGVWRGDFSFHILQQTDPAQLHLVDPWAFAPHYPKRMYGGRKAGDQAAMDEIAAGVARRFEGDRRVIMQRLASTVFFARVPEASLDWVYIDGDHSMQAVLDDLKGAWRAVLPGGYIVGDDYYWKDADGSLAVQQAVQTFTRDKQIEYSYIGGQFLMRR
jgi:hypothetical protein